MKRFALIPFTGSRDESTNHSSSASSWLSNITLTADIAVQQDRLQISFALNGAVAQLRIPAIADIPSRLDELWQHTCFEFFLSAPDSKTYWEFNCAPSGHWNVYQFDDYRSGMTNAVEYHILDFETKQHPHLLLMNIEVALPNALCSTKTIDAALCTVIEHHSGDLAYFAIAHPPLQADFHQRTGFISLETSAPMR